MKESKVTSARMAFNELSLSGWSVDSTNRISPGAQASVCVVKSRAGINGVFRTLIKNASQQQIDRFNREIPILTSKLKHRNIVSLCDWSKDNENPWYISELGNCFDTWWKQKQRELESDPAKLALLALDILRDILSALSECHKHGVVHRDVKPKNIVIMNEGNHEYPVLIDFGIAFDEEKERLTPMDDAVGNARFSPEVMKNRMDQVSAWVDVFSTAQLLIWMLSSKSAKSHWQGTIHWKYANYNQLLNQDLVATIRAYTASCSVQAIGPKSATEALELFDKLFMKTVATRDVVNNPAENIATAKKRGIAAATQKSAEIHEETESSEPLAIKVYNDIRNEVLAALKEIKKHESSVSIIRNDKFRYRHDGGEDLFRVVVGDSAHNIQLDIKVTLVPWSDTPYREKSHLSFWRKHLPKNAIPFTFALQGGIPAASNINFLDGRWVTILSNGTMMMHPLKASFGNYENNDLGGSAEGPGVPVTGKDVYDYVIALMTNERYWEYIGKKEVN